MIRSVLPGPVHLLRATMALLLLICFGLCAYPQQPPPVDRKQAPPGNVVVDGRVLFTIQTGIGPFSPAERAAATNAKLARLTENVLVNPNLIVTDEQETSTDIVAGDLIITSVTDADAKAAGIPRSNLANERLREIRTGLVAVRAQYSFKSLLLGALYALLTTLALIALLIGLHHFAPPLYAAIERWRGTRIRNVKIQSLELVSAERITEMLIQSIRLARTAATLVLFYFYIPLVFSFFPWTRSFGDTLLEYVFSPIRTGWAAFVSYLPSLLVVLVVLCFAYLANRIARFFFREIERGTITWPGFYKEWAMPTCRIVQILVIAFALVIMFPYLPGSDSPAFKGVSIFLGILFSLGSSSAISNIVAGVILTYARAFRIGDRVQIADTVGDVVEKSLLATYVRTIKNVTITVPNSMVLSSHIINFSASAADHPLILHTGVTIGYDAPWRTIHSLLINAALATPGVLAEPSPFVFQTSLDDFYVSYQINAYTNQPSRMAAIYSVLHQNIQEAFNEAGVEIMSPHYHAVRDGNTTTIPENHLPGDYEPQAFRVWQTRKGAASAGGAGTK
ncbi:MAG: mechanosensitive ion channel family protein [Bryobacteraceae bacterium]